MRKKSLLLCCVLAVLFSSCTSGSASLSETERIEAMVIEGVERQVAECVAGIESQTLLQDASVQKAETEGVARQELLASCQELYGMAAQKETASGQKSLEEVAIKKTDAGYGDDQALDILWDKCEQGSGEDCNRLFDEAPLGSEYERYGVSCGDREGVLRCEELGTESDPVPKIAAEAEKAAIG